MSTHSNHASASHFVAFTLTANLFFLLLFWVFDMHHISDENNLMEDLQAVVIVISMGIFIWQSLRVEPERRLTQWAAAWLGLSFLLRELDVEEIPGMPALLVHLGSGIGRNLMLAGGWLLILSATLYRVRQTKPQLTQLISSWLRSPAFLLMAAAAVFLITGDFCEKKLSTWWAEEFFEELAEFNGYCCMVLAALMVPANSVKRRIIAVDWAHTAAPKTNN